MRPSSELSAYGSDISEYTPAPANPTAFRPSLSLTCFGTCDRAESRDCCCMLRIRPCSESESSVSPALEMTLHQASSTTSTSNSSCSYTPRGSSTATAARLCTPKLSLQQLLRPQQAGSAQLAAAAALVLPAVGCTASMPAVLSRKAYSKAVSLSLSNLQWQTVAARHLQRLAHNPAALGRHCSERTALWSRTHCPCCTYKTTELQHHSHGAATRFLCTGIQLNSQLSHKTSHQAGTSHWTVRH